MTESSIFNSLKMKNLILWQNPLMNLDSSLVSCSCFERILNLQLYQYEDYRCVTDSFPNFEGSSHSGCSFCNRILNLELYQDEDSCCCNRILNHKLYQDEDSCWGIESGTESRQSFSYNLWLLWPYPQSSTLSIWSFVVER